MLVLGVHFPGLPHALTKRGEKLEDIKKVGRSHHSRADEGLGRVSIRTAWEAQEKSTCKDT